MNLKQLYYFKRLSETEHYTEAASSLCITQPSLSHAISELEKELGSRCSPDRDAMSKLPKTANVFCRMWMTRWPRWKMAEWCCKKWR